MSRYLIRRLVLLVPTLLGVTVVVFVLVRLLPGDAVTLQLQDAKATAADEAALRSQLGLPTTCAVAGGGSAAVGWTGWIVSTALKS